MALAGPPDAGLETAAAAAGLETAGLDGEETAGLDGAAEPTEDFQSGLGSHFFPAPAAGAAAAGLLTGAAAAAGGAGAAGRPMLAGSVTLGAAGLLTGAAGGAAGALGRPTLAGSVTLGVDTAAGLDTPPGGVTLPGVETLGVDTLPGAAKGLASSSNASFCLSMLAWWAASAAAAAAAAAPTASAAALAATSSALAAASEEGAKKDPFAFLGMQADQPEREQRAAKGRWLRNKYLKRIHTTRANMHVPDRKKTRQGTQPREVGQGKQ